MKKMSNVGAKPGYWLDKFSEALHQDREIYNQIREKNKLKFHEEVEKKTINHYKL